MIAVLLVACTACPKNTPPSALDFDIEPATPGTLDDLVVTITTEPADADGDALEMVYAWSRDGTVVPELSEDTVPAANTAKGEIWSCEVWADDGKALGPSTSKSVTVVNTGPTVDAVGIEPDEPRSDEDLEGTWTISDPDDDELTTELSWTVDGVPLPDLDDQPAVPATETARGEIWTLTVVASDGSADEAEGSAEVVIDNALPTAAVALTPDPAYSTDTVEASVETDDVDGDTVGLSYAWYVDEIAAGDGSSLSGFDRDQIVRVEVTPHDGTEVGETASAEVPIANSEPWVESGTVSISPDPAYEADTLSCSGTGGDDDTGDSLEWSLRWLVDGAEVSTDATLDGSLFDRDQSVQCALSATDGTASSGEELSQTLVISNTAPTITSVTLSDAAPVEGDTLSYTLTGASDDDGDALTYVPGWSVEGTWVSGDETLDSSFFGRGDEVYVRVRADDGTETGEPIKSDVATVGNTAPEITDVEIDGDLYTDSTATVSITSSDVDGDDVDYDYAWYVESTKVGTAATLEGDDWFEKDEDVYVIVTPRDDADSGSAQTATTVTVLNTPPSAPTLSIDPEEPSAGDSLQCLIDTDSSDPDDGDTVTYSFAWDYDGTAFTDTETTDETDDTVPSGETLDDEVWTCTVTPDDGDDDGDEGTAEVTVGGDCFVEVWSDDLSSKPSGSTTINGGWGGHSYTTVDGVDCMKQSSDWNYAYIPVTRASKDVEVIEVDIYHPTSSSSHVSWNVYWYGDHYGYNYVENGLWFNQGLSSASMSGGNTYSSSTTIKTWSSTPVPTSQWSTLRAHVDHSASTIDFYIDDVLETSQSLSSSNWINGANVVLRSGGQAYTTAPNTCWADLVIYEADEDNNCFE